MANQIKVAIRNSISTLHKRGWSQRRIARELGIDRETVARYIRLGHATVSKPAISTAGNAPPAGPKPAISTTGNTGRQSLCEPFREQIERKLGIGLTAQRIYQDLTFELGFEGSYESVKRFVRRIRHAHPTRVYRIETLPGEEAQVDFCRGAPTSEENGRRKRSHVLRVKLSFSRKSYSESVRRQTTEQFIRCMENAFREFGGAPKTVCLDNLRAAVKKADWFDPELNPKIESFARHYGTVFLPTRPYTPKDKGKVERDIQYLKSNALKGRVFDSLEGQNKYLRWWERAVADCRIHGTTRKQVGKLFEEHEKPALLPLPPMLFPCFEEGQRTVHRDGFVEVARAYYEVPDEYIGRKVWVRWDSRLVRVFNQRFEQIAVLARIPPGKFSSCLGARGRRTSIERSTAYWLKQAQFIGENAGEWAFAVMNNRGPQGIRVLQGLVSLTKKHLYKDVERACELAVSHGAYRLRDLRRLLRAPSRQDTFEFLESHPLIRDMSEYGAFMKTLVPEKAPTTGKEVVQV